MSSFAFAATRSEHRVARPMRVNNIHPVRGYSRKLKGEFMLADRGYCYSLTISDFASRYLSKCRGMGRSARG